MKLWKELMNHYHAGTEAEFQIVTHAGPDS